jgi:predicted dithiol-disulfide oxidoreductase (DUF899 family)
MITDETVALPQVVSRSEWLKARKELLAQEKTATRLRDAVNAQRRRLPMVKVEQSYVFEGPAGKVSLRDIFEGRRQLYVHHFMWNDETETHCPGCTAAAHQIFTDKVLEVLRRKDIAFAAISRAPLAKIMPYKLQHDWKFPWYSSNGTSFNYDFHITLDESVAPIEYNYRSKAELKASGESDESLNGDRPGTSIFVRKGEEVFHAYSAYTRGTDFMLPSVNMLDLTPYGRQEDWEDSPPGWPQQPTYG